MRGLRLLQTTTRSSLRAAPRCANRQTALRFNLWSCHMQNIMLKNPVGTPIRSFAKKAQKKGKDKGKGKAAKMDMAADSPIDLEEVDQDLQASVDRCVEKLSNLRLGRANPDLLDNLKLKAYDQVTTIKEVSSVNARSAQLLIVSVHDTELLDAVETVIRDAGLDLSPFQQGGVIHVPMPKPNKEAKENMMKQAKALCEDGKNSIRKERQTAMKKLKKASKETSEDILRQCNQNIDDMTSSKVAALDEALKDKQAELMG